MGFVENVTDLLKNGFNLMKKYILTRVMLLRLEFER